MSTIVDKILEISEIKDACREAIIEKKNLDSTDFPSSTPFAQYGNKLLGDSSGGLCELEDLTISKNGEYKAKTGKAWSNIDVNVSLKTKSVTITENGDYDVSDDTFMDDDGGNPDAFSSIKVEVSTEGKTKLISKTVTDNDIEVDINDEDELINGYSSIKVAVNLRDSKEIKLNGSFNIADEPYNERKETVPYGYSKIIVNQKIEEKDIEVPSSPYTWSVTDEKYTPITKDEDKIQGYSHIHIKTAEGDGPFTVRFMDEETVLYTTSVYKGGTASYSGTLPTKNGKYFCGWNPSPKNVQNNLDVKAVWADTASTYSSWNDIIADGNSVPIGTQMKLYVPGYDFREEYGADMSATGGQVTCKKVYSGEGGTSSTWLFKMHSGYSVVTSPHIIKPTESIFFDESDDPEHLFKFCDFLNKKLSILLQARNEGLVLRPVLKLTETCVLRQDQYSTRKLTSSMPILWIASYSELIKTDSTSWRWLDGVSGIHYNYENNTSSTGVYRTITVGANPGFYTENAALFPTLSYFSTSSSYQDNPMSGAYIGFCTP